MIITEPNSNIFLTQSISPHDELQLRNRSKFDSHPTNQNKYSYSMRKIHRSNITFLNDNEQQTKHYSLLINKPL